MIKYVSVILVFIASQAFAQPSVSSVTGTLTQGQTVTINGSSFGAHADYGGSLAYLNAAWNRYESIGCSIGTGALGGGWSVNNDSHLPNFSATTTNGRTNGTCWIRKTGAVSRQGELHFDKVTDTGKGSAHIWFTNNGTAGVAQGKYIRTWYDEGDFWLSTFGHSTNTGAAPGICTGCAGPNATIDPEEAASPLGNSTSWNLIDLYYCSDAGCGSGDPSTSNYMRWYVNGQQAADAGTLITGTQFVPATMGEAGHTFDVMELIEEDGSAWGADDTYFDHSWAGVVVCTGSTWANRMLSASSGDCEWQPLLSWSSTQITVEFNLGVNSSATGLYVYVVDENLVPNSTGFLISGGGGGSGGFWSTFRKGVEEFFEKNLLMFRSLSLLRRR